ncbi:MAG: TetR family transcriptional regulator [Rhodobacterales bacterium]|nr:TetR family transcriptional regulator [Rhodobacterales bacterium]
MTNLRARQRLLTTEAIRQSAIELVHAKGLDNVTTEMISEAAGISPRTFFNYFPYKEAALVPPTEEFCEATITKFLAADGNLIDDLADLITPMTSVWDGNRPLLRKLFEIADSHPKLVMLKANSVHEHEMGLRTLLVLRFKTDEHAYAPILVAAVVTSAIRVAMEHWASEEKGSAEQCVRRALYDIQTMFDTPS